MTEQRTNFQKEQIDHFKAISFRPINENDLPFLFQVYADTRQDEFKNIGWIPEQIDSFLRMQFNLQHKQYLENYQQATFEIILWNEIQIGRLYVNRTNDDIRIIDIALLSQYRHQGIGSRIIMNLITESEEKKIPLSLHVEQNNPAMGLYEKLGFVKIKSVSIYYFMKRNPTV